ncbi:MAG: HipA family kinase [Ardenticatenales bacterium]
MTPTPVAAVRYVTPLREGGSLPAVVEGDDGRLWVAKFRGAGQGPKVLVAEWVAGALAKAIGLPVPEIVPLSLDARFGVAERDPEIRALLAASAGLNLGMAFLPEAFGFDPLHADRVAPELAARIVWFDALVTNIDRTARNPNLLWSGGALWLIDHGASLYVAHGWRDAAARAAAPFGPIADHVLLGAASADAMRAADADWAERLDGAALSDALDSVPDAWLAGDAVHPTPEAHREAYRAFLSTRLAPPRAWAAAAADAVAQAAGRAPASPDRGRAARPENRGDAR